MSSWWYWYHRWRAQDETDQCLVKHTVVLNWEFANGWRCSSWPWTVYQWSEWDHMEGSLTHCKCQVHKCSAILNEPMLISTFQLAYLYIMYFYIHTCGGQSKGGLASARGQWFLKGFKIMIKTKTSFSDFQMPFSSKSCKFGRFSSCLKWQNWLLLDISLLPMLHSDKFVLPIIQMSNDPPIYLCVKECILRAYSASVCTWDSCYQPCPSDSLGRRMRP